MQLDSIGITFSHLDYHAAARDLAAALALPLLESITEATGSRLHLDEQGLAFIAPDTAPVRVDFCNKKSLYREKRYSHELLLRACGLTKSALVNHVVDATAGLGGDAALLACAAKRLTLIERSPIVAALLGDGIARARLDGRAAIGRCVLQLHNADASQALPKLDDVDVIYLDPMFPHKQKNALPPKAMQALQHLLHSDQTGEAAEQVLLASALAAATYRVVVKRPLKAPPLAAQAADFSIKGKQVRYDCYALKAIS